MAWAVVATTATAWAQPVVSLPNSSSVSYQPQSGVYAPQGTAVAPPGGFPPPTTPVPPSSLGAPAFDPYSGNPGAASVPPTLNAPPSTYGSPMPPGTNPVPGTVPPYPGTTGNVMGGSPTAPYSQPYGSYPPGAAPGTAPPSLYPNGWNNPNWALPTTQFLTPRVRYTYVNGGDGYDDLGINDFDFSVAMAFPSCLGSTQPLHFVPSFSLHLWEGPRPPAGDLPPNAYSAYLDFGWSTPPTQPFGGEIGVRLGIFSDFNSLNKYSSRIMGQGLFRIQTTPTTTLRGGVMYLDRNKIKLLPAFGLLWTPNNQTRFDIFFPRPKLSQHLTTTGNHDLWWYLSGEYGGGAWAVEREGTSGSFSDDIDINDIRLILGLEWGQSALLKQGRRTGFAEIGWVTSREVIYRVTPNESSSLSDSFMLRAGWNY